MQSDRIYCAFAGGRDQNQPNLLDVAGYCHLFVRFHVTGGDAAQRYRFFGLENETDAAGNDESKVSVPSQSDIHEKFVDVVYCCR